MRQREGGRERERETLPSSGIEIAVRRREYPVNTPISIVFFALISFKSKTINCPASGVVSIIFLESKIYIYILIIEYSKQITSKRKYKERLQVKKLIFWLLLMVCTCIPYFFERLWLPWIHTSLQNILSNEFMWRTRINNELTIVHILWILMLIIALIIKVIFFEELKIEILKTYKK